MPIERLHRLARPAPLAIGILCAALCLPAAAAARGTAPVAVEVADSYLELHTGPGRGYPVTRVIPRGDHVEVLKRRTDWYLRPVPAKGKYQGRVAEYLQELPVSALIYIPLKLTLLLTDLTRSQRSLGFVTQTRAGFMTRDPRGEDMVAIPRAG